MVAVAPQLAEQSAPERGRLLPRLAPAPLATGRPGECGCGCALTRDNSYGFAVADFARDVLQMPLDPWQRWLVIHAGELLPDGRPRFKKLLIIVARQNGKSFLLLVLTLFWLFVEQWPMIVGQHLKLSKAKGVWEQAQKIAKRTPELAAEFGYVRKDNNDPHWETTNGDRYVIEAANENGGRGGSVDRTVIDELRQQRTWAAYNAIKPTINAKPFGQIWWISNQGDARSIVLLALRKTGLANLLAQHSDLGMELEPDVRDMALETEELEEPDEDLGLFEWSARPGSSMTDPAALAAANPNMGNTHHGPSLKALLGDARSAIRSGDPDMITGFKTEIMCMYVPAMDNAIDPAGWERGEQPGDLAAHRSRLALVPELSPDRQHASVSVAALLPDGKVRVEVVASWSGALAATQLRRELPRLAAKVKPRKLGWLAGGPIEAIAADLTTVKDGRSQRFPGVEIEPIRAELPAVCMGLAELVAAGDLLHSGQELLTKQTLGSAKLWRGDVWVFSRKGDGHCDATYGIAAAAHLARTMPPGNRYQRGTLRSVK